MRSMLVIALVVAGGAAHARADDRESPDDLVARPVVLDDGGIDLRLTVEIGVQNFRLARPLSLAPDAWWGVARDWTIGVIHSDSSVDQIEAGATLCVRDSFVPTCSHPYRGSGVDVRFKAVAGALAVAPRVRLLVRDVDPFKPAMTLGALVRWTRGRFAIASDPFLRVPLAHGDLGNRSALSIPLWLSAQPARGWMITAHTGFDADVAVLRDGSHAPFGLAVTVRVTPEVDLALEAGWGRLFGPQYNARASAVLITVGWHR